MFEAVVALCLAAEPGLCRTALVPGHEAETLAACAASLAATAYDPAEGLQASEPACVPQAEGLRFDEVAPGVFVHRGAVAEADAENGGDIANIAFVVGTRSVAVIDSGGAAWIGEDVWRAIRVRTRLPVSDLILTHMHPDHVLGADSFVRTGTRIVGHARLQRALADRGADYLQNTRDLIGEARFIGTTVALPSVGVTTTMEIDLGGRVLTLTAWPEAHTGTDLSVTDSASGILFAGDLVFDRHAPALDGSLLGWQAVLADLAALPNRQVVPGHGGPVLAWPDAARPVERYLGVLAADTRAALADGKRLAEAVATVAASEAGNWALFELHNRRNATVAYTELEWE